MLVTGEGGTFALFQGLYPPERRYVDAKRSEKDNGLEKTNSDSSMDIIPSTSTAPSRFKWIVFVWVRSQSFSSLLDRVNRFDSVSSVPVSQWQTVSSLLPSR